MAVDTNSDIWGDQWSIGKDMPQQTHPLYEVGMLRKGLSMCRGFIRRARKIGAKGCEGFEYVIRVQTYIQDVACGGVHSTASGSLDCGACVQIMLLKVIRRKEFVTTPTLLHMRMSDLQGPG